MGYHSSVVLTLTGVAGILSAQASVGVVANSGVSGRTNADSRLPILPLHAEGRWIVDAASKRVKLACVNWYGGESPDYVVGGLNFQSISSIAGTIAGLGFNCVRLPWSVELVLENPLLASKTVTAEPSLLGKRGLDALDAVVDGLDAAGLMIVLDNHMSRADWCCSTQDGNGLWYTDDYNATMWLAAWTAVAKRYAHVKHVIGADLRNELRSATVGDQYLTPTWGDGNAATDWHMAATAAGNAVLSINPNWLIIVEGLNYATDLTGVRSHPIMLQNNAQLVYESHDYVFDSTFSESYDTFAAGLTSAWGYILNGSSPTPVWLGECGTCHTNTSQCVDGPVGLGLWWQYLMRYLSEQDLSWSYWAIDGTQSTGTGRTWGAEETYGILNMTWNGIASQPLLQSLQALMPSSRR